MADRLHDWQWTNDFPEYVCEACGERCFGPPNEDNPDTGWFDPCPKADDPDDDDDPPIAGA